MKALVFHTSTNRKGKHDASGAFNPEARAFQKLHEIPDEHMLGIPHGLKPWTRRKRFENQCRAHADGTFDAVVYFGHGTPRGLPGLGYRVGNDGHDRMASIVASVLSSSGRVVLYACLAGKGFGFADRLAVSLRYRDPKAEVIAHLSKGHTSWNPVCEYSGRGKGRTGLPIIGRRNALWQKWVKRLREDQAFRLSFPFMDVLEIARELDDTHTPPGPSGILPERP